MHKGAASGQKAIFHTFLADAGLTRPPALADCAGQCHTVAAKSPAENLAYQISGTNVWSLIGGRT